MRTTRPLVTAYYIRRTPLHPVRNSSSREKQARSLPVRSPSVRKRIQRLAQLRARWLAVGHSRCRHPRTGPASRSPLRWHLSLSSIVPSMQEFSSYPFVIWLVFGCLFSPKQARGCGMVGRLSGVLGSLPISLSWRTQKMKSPAKVLIFLIICK